MPQVAASTGRTWRPAWGTTPNQPIREGENPMPAPTTSTDTTPESGFTDADWAEAVQTGTFPEPDPAAPSAPPVADADSTGTSVDTAYLLAAANWLPLDYAAVAPPNLGGLVADHKRRTRGIKNGGLRTGHIAYATLASFSGLGLNTASWAVALLSTLVNRGLISGEDWHREDGRPLRPRSLAKLTADNANRATAMNNTAAKSVFILAAASARTTAQPLNVVSYGLARLAVTVNDPARLGVASIPVVFAVVAWLIWTVVGGA